MDLVARADAALISVVTLGELEAGFLLGGRLQDNRVSLQDFLAEPFVQVVTITPEVARGYGRLFAMLRRAGTPLPTNDLWIAACAEAAGATLLTYDTDFARIEGLDCAILHP